MLIKEVKFIKSAQEVVDWPPGEEPEVAFVGRSNVGKSSVINSLLGRKGLARTSNTPGRTQLINFFSINGNFRFVDLPGYGYSRVPASVKRGWGPMIERYLRERENLKLVTLLLDVRRIPHEQDISFLNWLRLHDRETIVVLNKIDKLSHNELAKQLGLIAQGLKGILEASNLIQYSSVSGAGKEDLWQEIKKRVDMTLRL